jgi:hypothetical protein
MFPPPEMISSEKDEGVPNWPRDGLRTVFGAYQEGSGRTNSIVESLQACPSGYERHTGLGLMLLLC